MTSPCRRSLFTYQAGNCTIYLHDLIIYCASPHNRFSWRLRIWKGREGKGREEIMLTIMIIIIIMSGSSIRALCHLGQQSPPLPPPLSPALLVRFFFSYQSYSEHVPPPSTLHCSALYPSHIISISLQHHSFNTCDTTHSTSDGMLQLIFLTRIT